MSIIWPIVLGNDWGKIMTQETAIKNAIQGGYDFKISQIIKEAWQKTKGIKAPFWGGFLFNLFIGAFLLALLSAAITMPDIVNHLHFSTNKIIDVSLKLLGLGVFFIIALFALLLSLPLFAGILMLSVKRVVELPVKSTMIFKYFSFKYQLLFALFLSQLISNVPSSILNGIASHLSTYLIHRSSVYLILGGLLLSATFLFAFCLSVYFYISYLLYIPLVIDKKLNAWRALETSRKAIGHHWFKTLGLMLSFAGIIIISIIPVGIPLIWTLPMVNNGIAILYRTIFGIEER